jgi:hypothetical protein
VRPRWPARAALLALALAAPGAAAHPLAPVLLELEERAGGEVAVAWKRPLRAGDGVQRAPVLPAGCARGASLAPSATDLTVTERWLVDCGEAGLVGRRVGVEGLDATGTDALLRVTLRDGRVLQRVLRPDAASVVVPERTPRSEVARDYAALGFEHILGGADHLLFVFGLLLLVGGGMRLVQTVSAFTVGHSVTLSLAALGFVGFPSRPIEVLIAASVLWLAVDLARSHEAPRSWMRRAPWGMAGAFGLLHGLGFAGALAETGLPEGEIPLALLFFNLGIEAGQLLFVGVLVVAGHALRRIAAPLPAPALRVPVYAMGSLAAFWCLERIAVWAAG